MRYHWTSSLFFILVSWAVGCRSEQPADLPSLRPNILFAIADDWGWPHAGAYGDTVVSTATFDRLVEEGIKFEHAYVSSPSCTPSRAAILTGQWHWRLEESANLWSTLQSKFDVYPDLLEAGGYHVGFTRKGWGPGKLEPGGRQRNPAGKHFNSFGEFLEARPQGMPFCFWFGSQDPHRGYDAGSGVESGMKLEEIEPFACFPESDEIRSDIADYYWEVQRFDREVGELVALLEKSGELENTLIVMTGDHGMPFPRCKGNLYDTGTRVPLAMCWPQMLTPGRVVEQFVSLTDLAPTFLELAGLAVPGSMTGSSLKEILTTQQPRTDRSFILFGKERHCPAQEDPDSGGTPMRAIRTKDFLYIRNYRPDRWPAGTPRFEKAFFPGSWYGDVDNGPTKFYMIDHRDKDELHRQLFDLAFSKRPAEELYDLRSDPAQLNNVSEDPAYRQINEDLSKQLTEHLLKTQDPRAANPDPPFDDYPYYGGSPLKPGYEPSPQ